MKSRSQLPRSATETGQFPRPDLSLFSPHEPPEPGTPEDEIDPGSITGVIPLIPEGKDAAKDRDDSAAGKRR